MNSQPQTRSVNRLLGVIVTALGAGWLASGSCSVAGCYEDCDPCYQQCQCKTVCHNPAAGQHGLTIVARATRSALDRDGRFVRVFDVALGPAIELAADGLDSARGARPASDRIAAFALRLLDANAGLFAAAAASAWDLAAVHAFPTRTAVQFERRVRPYERARANSVTFLFDDFGRLLEVAQVVEAASD